MSQSFAQPLKDYTKGSKFEHDERIRDLLQKAPTEPGLHCPKCGTFAGGPVKAVLEKHAKQSTSASQIKKTDFKITRKSVFMYLLLDPNWLKGSPGEIDGALLGGYAGAAPEQSASWYAARAEHLTLIEVRGRLRLTEEEQKSSNLGESASDDSNNITNVEENTAADNTDIEMGETGSAGVGEDANHKQYGLPREFVLPDGKHIQTRYGTVPEQAAFVCQACGRQNQQLAAMEVSRHTAPIAIYALQCYCPECEIEGYNYGGRYFKTPDKNDIQRLTAVETEWEKRSEGDLRAYWPREKLPFAHMTHERQPLPQYGYTHWWTMFNSRQLLMHALVLRAITEAYSNRWPLDVCEQALGAFQQSLRYSSMFSFYQKEYDKVIPHFSNANYHPKARVAEVTAFSKLGAGRWTSLAEMVIEGVKWSSIPWEYYINTNHQAKKVVTGDPIRATAKSIECASATDLTKVGPESIDLVITDPPFGDNVFYADLADFFYVWLRIPMLRWYEGRPEAEYFLAAKTPRALEAITNRAEHPDTRANEEKKGLRPPADEFYQQTLTACWAEAYRVLKPGGLLAFTFHHSADEPWVNVLASLFDAGFILVATYPIRSDESKGESGQFGSRKIEYDIIHVCRKRTEEPTAVSWARMRAWVKDEVANLRRMLELYRDEQLAEADIRVILRGKALEYYSRHYGQILTGAHEPLSIRDALIGINQLLDDTSESGGSKPPESAHPITRLFLTVFHGRTSLNRDDLSKFLRGNIVPSEEFLGRGWATEAHKIVRVVTIPERFRELRKPGRRRDTISFDLDQAHFLIGAALPGSGIDIQRELSEHSMQLHPSVEPLLEWYSETSEDWAIREAAARAQRLVNAWRDERKRASGLRQGQLFEDDLEYETGA